MSDSKFLDDNEALQDDKIDLEVFELYAAELKAAQEAFGT